MTVWKTYISTFTRFIANTLGRLLTLRRIFSMQMLKSSPTSCLYLLPNYKVFDCWLEILLSFFLLMFPWCMAIVNKCCFKTKWMRILRKEWVALKKDHVEPEYLKCETLLLVSGSVLMLDIRYVFKELK